MQPTFKGAYRKWPTVNVENEGITSFIRLFPKHHFQLVSRIFSTFVKTFPHLWKLLNSKVTPHSSSYISQCWIRKTFNIFCKKKVDWNRFCNICKQKANWTSRKAKGDVKLLDFKTIMNSINVTESTNQIIFQWKWNSGSLEDQQSD